MVCEEGINQFKNYWKGDVSSPDLVSIKNWLPPLIFDDNTKDPIKGATHYIKGEVEKCIAQIGEYRFFNK